MIYLFVYLLLILNVFFIIPNSILSSANSNLHVYGSTDSIDIIGVQVVYYVPFDSEPLLDWRERIESHMHRVKKFHARELGNQSELNYTIYPSPFIASATKDEFPQDDVNRFYWHIINEVWHSGKLSFNANSFPIILVFSDNNFSPGYNDWIRECNGKDCIFPPPHSKCAGYVKENGEDRPGTRCGGARSVFWPEKHMGFGLVTADGWRVPIKGTDCVVYHEGIGHAIGLPHSEPLDNSVMGLAQYVDSINKTWLNEKQKKKLGYKPTTNDKKDLFTHFEVSHSPSRPLALKPVKIQATFPRHIKIKRLKAEYQTALRSPFQSLGKATLTYSKKSKIATWCIPPIQIGESIAYRVRLETESHGSEEIWNYYKIRE